jgi:cGMP-dependent protein kinase
MGAGGSVEECFPEADKKVKDELSKVYEAKYKDMAEGEMRTAMQKEYEQLSAEPKKGKKMKRQDSISRRKANKKKNNMFFQKGLRMSQLRRFPSKADMSEGLDTKKTPEQVELIRNSINDTLFEATEKNAIDKVISSMTKHHLDAGETLAARGTTNFKFSVVEFGKIQFISANGEVNSEYTSTQHYGEMSLIFEEELPFDVIATEETVVWELGRDMFRQIQHLCNAHSLSERAKWLQQVKILENLTTPQLARVASAMKTMDFNATDQIVKQGDEGDIFYVIQSGEVEIYVKDARRQSAANISKGQSSPREDELQARLVDTIGPGDYFGEKALITMDRRNATCRAKTTVRCLVMAAADFKQVMGPMADLLKNNGLMNSLNQLEVLKPLPRNVREVVINEMREVDFAADSEIVKQGDNSPGLYILQAGEIFYMDEGQERVINQGMSFGEESWAGNAETFTIKTKTAATCMLLALDSLNSAIEPFHWKLSQSDGGLKLDVIEETQQQELMCSGPLSNLGIADLESVAVLGEGSFGQVQMVKATHPVSKEVIALALKRMCKQHIVESGQAEHIQRERDVLAKIPACNFLLHLFATFQDQDCVYMLTNLCQGGELFSLIHTFDGDIPLEMPQAKFYACHVFLALEHLHNHGVIYRDMKPENILLDHEGYLCVIDLGFGKFVPFEEEIDGVMTAQDMTYTMCGTPEYMAPEFVLQTGHNGGVDYWALGVLIYEMMFARTPFLPEDEDMAQLFKNIAAVRTRGGEKAAGPNVLYFPSEFRAAEPEAVDLVCSLLAGNPMYRLGMLHNGSKDFRNHAWFSNVDWKQVENKEIEAEYKPAVSDQFDCSHFDDEDIGQLPIMQYTPDQNPQMKEDPFVNF